MWRRALKLGSNAPLGRRVHTVVGCRFFWWLVWFVVSGSLLCKLAPDHIHLCVWLWTWCIVCPCLLGFLLSPTSWTFITFPPTFYLVDFSSSRGCWCSPGGVFAWAKLVRLWPQSVWLWCPFARLLTLWKQLFLLLLPKHLLAHLGHRPIGTWFLIFILRGLVPLHHTIATTKWHRLCQLHLLFVVSLVSGWDLPLRNQRKEFKGLGKPVSGLLRFYVGRFLRFGLLLSCLCSLLCTLSFEDLAFANLSGHPQLPSTTSCCQSSQTPVCHTPSHPSQRRRSIAVEQEWSSLRLSNDGLSGGSCCIGGPGKRPHEFASFQAATRCDGSFRVSRGICDSSFDSTFRFHGGSPNGLLTRRVADCWRCGLSRRHDRAFPRCDCPWMHRGGRWRRASLRTRDRLLVGGSACLCPATFEEVQSCRRRPWNSAFCPWRSGCFADLDCTFGASEGMAGTGPRGSSCFLFSRRGSTYDASSISASAKEKSSSESQGDHGYASRAIVVTGIDSPWSILTDLGSSGAAESFRSSFERSRCREAATPQEGVRSTSVSWRARSCGSLVPARFGSSSSLKGYSSATVSAAEPSTSSSSFSHYDSGRRASSPAHGRGLSSLQGSWRRSGSFSDPLATVPSSHSFSGSHGEPGGGLGSRRISIELFPHIERLSQKRQAAGRSSSQERRLHAQGGAKCLQKDEAFRKATEEPGRVWGRKGFVHQVSREAWWLLRGKGHGLDHVVAGSHLRPHAPERLCRGSGDDSPNDGQHRTDGSRWSEVGCSMASKPSGRPTCCNVQCAAGIFEPSAQSFRTSMSPRLGCNNPELCEGAGHHFISEARSTPRSEGRRLCSTKGARSEGSIPEDQAAQISQEAQEVRRPSSRSKLKAMAQVPGQSARSMSSPPGRPGVTISGSGDNVAAVPEGEFGAGPCSETSSCRANATSAAHSMPSWDKLQTFSFREWCSSLYSKVSNSKTPFAVFLKKTCHVARVPHYAPASALFPIPVPKCGIFDGAKVGSRQRRKRSFERAFHVCVMAMNFWHADFKFVPEISLALHPSPAQIKVLRDLRNLLRAFGSNEESFNVPQSGRRSTALVALLADLSDFVTWEGLAGDSYLRGFPGCAEGFGHEGAPVPSRNDRAEELVPYRSLDPSRLKLSGAAAWDPTDHLSDLLWLAYVEPDSLLWTKEMPPEGDYPNLDKEDYNAVKDLALLWDSRGLLHLQEAAPSHDWREGSMRFFNCYKSSTADRMIGDRRLRNWREGKIPGVSRFLPTGVSLGALEVQPETQRLSICVADRRDFYHQFRVSRSRARSNALWPPIKLEDMVNTKAYKIWQEALSGSQRYDREREGDQLAGPRKKTKLSDVEKLVPCFGSIPQGDHLGVEIATEAHRNLLRSRGQLSDAVEMRSSQLFRGSQHVQGLVIDDFYAISVEPRNPTSESPSKALAGFYEAKRIYDDEGLLGSDDKDVVDASTAKVTGAELDSSDALAAMNLATLGSPCKKRLALSFVTLELVGLRWTTDALHACLLGGWTHSLLYRRPMMSVLQEAYKLSSLSSLDQDNPQLVRLTRSVAQELTVLAVLAPFMAVNLAASFGDKLYATDSSDKKGAFVARPVRKEALRTLWRAGRKKGGYVRLQSREEALIQKIDVMKEPIVEDASHDIQCDRPLAYRFHFIEICGGAGKITASMVGMGWHCGPVLDLEASVHYDLGALRLLQWVIALLEEGRLDSFIVEPPCTTFSPAQHPASRGYDCPRGYDPTEPKTLKGTVLALRALTLMYVGATTGTPSLLEQPRKSKMRRLQEWQRLLQLQFAYEEWLASCMYGSPHKKEFVFLAANIDVTPLHIKCSRDHEHIQIRGPYAKPSATYTDALAEAVAHCFDKALARRLRCENHFSLKSKGLESPLCNDLLVSGDWQVQDVWRWKKPGHINIREVASASRLLHQLAVEQPCSRPVIVMDSNVGLSALVKGRSSSYGLQKALRRTGAAVVAGGLYPAYLFGPTRIIPADHPTRDHAIPEPSTSIADMDLDFCQLLDFAGIQGLSRFAANWVRLSLLMLARPVPWWSSRESWRYAHLSAKSYRFSKAARRSAVTPLEFDQTLGYPGEGPSSLSLCTLITLQLPCFGFQILDLWILFLSVAAVGFALDYLQEPSRRSVLYSSTLSLSWIFLHGLWEVSCWICKRLLAFPGFCIDLVCPSLCGSDYLGLWLDLPPAPTRPCRVSQGVSAVSQFGLPFLWIFPVSRPPYGPGTKKTSFGVSRWWFLVVLGMTVVPGVHSVSHGQLMPRDAADRKRAALRVPADLPSGRPVLKQTQIQRDRLLSAFDDWLKTEGFELSSLLDVVSPDPEAINMLLERYGRSLYKAGRPYGHYSETINAVVGRRPTLRRMMQQSWDLAFAWLRQEPPIHHVALPWQALLSLISASLSWGWTKVAGVLALSWGGITRIGEVFAGCRRNLILPSDLGGTISYALLEIQEPKTRFRTARHQVAKVDQCQLVKVIELAFLDLEPSSRLWPHSPQTMRTRFKKLLEAIGLSTIPPDLQRGLDLGSLRAGGATWLLLESEDAELTRRRGRWISPKVMEVYCQESNAVQFLPRLSVEVRERILKGASIFPWCLEVASRLSSSGVPTAVWYIIFHKEAAELDGLIGCFSKEGMGVGKCTATGQIGHVTKLTSMAENRAVSSWTVGFVTVKHVTACAQARPPSTPSRLHVVGKCTATGQIGHVTKLTSMAENRAVSSWTVM